ncbi:GapR family DNA-binding domain-containing protein, partial [Neomegalonema sp.]|uniref:GapR family DNA-binding domain-containing protein n=1 Tax=Neomegalonema sp. TaxID=2039713 RepID=UPI002617E183
CLAEVVEDLEGLAVEQEALRLRINSVKDRAKSRGLSVKVIGSILKLRKMSEEARAEYEGLLDLYKADLGMLDGTPLGKYARDRMAKEKKPEEDLEAGAPAPEDPAEPEAPPPPTPEEIEAARKAGGAAFAEGRDVLANPFGAADPRRAAWDEGFCAAAGSDGMDIPDAWRPAKPRKKDGSKGDGK